MGTHPSEVITNTAQRILEAKKIVADAEQRFATLMQEMETDLARVLKDQEHVHDREPREHSSAGLVQAPTMSVFSPTPRINKQRGRPKGSRKLRYSGEAAVQGVDEQVAACVKQRAGQYGSGRGAQDSEQESGEEHGEG